LKRDHRLRALDAVELRQVLRHHLGEVVVLPHPHDGDEIPVASDCVDLRDALNRRQLRTKAGQPLPIGLDEDESGEHCCESIRNQTAGRPVIQEMVDTVPLKEPGLITAARAGDAAAFDALVGPLVEPAYKLALVMLRDGSEAQDAVQEATIKAWRKLDQLREDSQLRAWFLSIVANQCRTLRQTKWWSVLRVASVQKADDFLEEGVESNIDLKRAISALSLTDRAVLFLFFYVDAPLAEVARILEISPQAAKSRVHRAVLKLRSSLTEVSQ
jgi:RNA polymerase sigma-70 factor (ECF subfamily)